MGNSLPEVAFFMNENVFVSNHIQKRIVHNINPNILWNETFMNTNGTVLLQKAIFFCIAKCIAAMSSFRWTVIGMCIQVDAIDLWQINHLGSMQSFGCTFN